MKLGVISLGCDKATVDSERLVGELVGHGAVVTPELQAADVILVNTCGFIDAAKQESIEKVLGTLKDREAKILRLYFGLEGQDPMTLEEIGSQLGITRERVRQIKEKALARLRHISRARALDSFLT